jgi:hypothetical protein
MEGSTVVLRLKYEYVVAMLACGALLSVFRAPLLAHELTTPSPHEAMVERGSKDVMPFDMNRTLHIFKPTADGGVQIVQVHDTDPKQIALVRSHLRKEASAFAHGDFSDPAQIHGMDMPGLAQLRAGASRIAIRYADRADGGSIRYKTLDRQLVAAIHEWFAAQVKDHGLHARMAP